MPIFSEPPQAPACRAAQGLSTGSAAAARDAGRLFSGLHLTDADPVCAEGVTPEATCEDTGTPRVGPLMLLH